MAQRRRRRSTLFFAIVLAELWRATAIVLVILVAGLQLIPKEFGEAADDLRRDALDGASRRITLPLLKPSLQSALILRTVLAFEVFAVVYALGGRNFPVLVGEAYVWQNDNQNYGVAAAYAVLVMAISLAATAVYLRVLRVQPEAAAMSSARCPARAGPSMSLRRRWLLLRLGAGADLSRRRSAPSAAGSACSSGRSRSVPTDLSFADAMATFLRIEGVWNAALNSLIAAALTMVFSIALGAPAGYALARFRFRGADAFRLLVLLTRAFPLAILALPLTVSSSASGSTTRRSASPWCIPRWRCPSRRSITASLFTGIPRELEEAAWVFGCTRWQAFRKVVLPLALPGIAAAAIFAFVISWNEVFAASVLTVRERTLTAYLLTVLPRIPLHYRFAGGFILIVPSVIFIFAVRSYLFAMWGIANK